MFIVVKHMTYNRSELRQDIENNKKYVAVSMISGAYLKILCSSLSCAAQQCVLAIASVLLYRVPSPGKVTPAPKKFGIAWPSRMLKKSFHGLFGFLASQAVDPCTASLATLRRGAWARLLPAARSENQTLTCLTLAATCPVAPSRLPKNLFSSNLLGQSQ